MVKPIGMAYLWDLVTIVFLSLLSLVCHDCWLWNQTLVSLLGPLYLASGRWWTPSLTRKVQNEFLEKGLVSTSAIWHWDGTYFMTRVPSETFSHTKWWSISIYLVRSWKTGFMVIRRALKLSLNSWGDCSRARTMSRKR